MKIEWQRCFKIPKDKLDLFLVKIKMSDHNTGYYQADYIFKQEEYYDVVVSEYQDHYPYLCFEIEKFAESLKNND